ncbi:MAG: hypothetical protein ACRCYX_02875 [Dermatophilaceae bacterium]
MTAADETESRRFGVIRMRGGRYDDHGLPLFGAAELERYEALVAKVARSLFLGAHPQRQRVPRGFADAFSLRLTGLEDGSVVPVLERAAAGAWPADGVPVGEPEDWFESARVLINTALRGFGAGPVPADRRFPADCIPDLAALGRSLRDEESIELSDDGADPAVLDTAVRRRIREASNLGHLEVETVLHGQVTGLRSDPQQFDFVSSATGQKVTGRYAESATWNELKEFQGYASRSPMVALSVLATQSPDGEVHQIVDVLGVEAALPEEWAERIDVLAGLEPGWFAEGSEPPSPQALDAAEQLLLACVDAGVGRPGIFPTPEGGVQLEWSTARVELEVVFTGATARVLSVSRVDDGEHEEEVDAEDSERLVGVVRRALDG